MLHAFEGSTPFGKPTLDKIAQLKAVYDLDLTAADAHRLVEAGSDGQLPRAIDHAPALDRSASA
ncbi:hypothetical protein [Cellulomonas hominis]